MKLNSLPLALALAALLLLPIAGCGVRLRLWPVRAGLALFALGILGAVVAAATAAVFLALPRLRSGAAGSLLLALALGLVAAYVPGRSLATARRVPMIHDISTDLAEPPAFVAILPLRASAPNPASYGGPEVAAEQRRAYPDIVPLDLVLPPAAAYQRALAAARAMDWQIVAADPATGRIEATATSFWFGFKDDVVVRVKAAPAGGGSRVDVRSVSRVGRSDVGANAARIRAYFTRLGAAKPEP
jgi:uncharacterized protein (DUF1499 family)